MARTAALRTSTTERVSVLETKVDNIDEKLVDIKADMKDMHDCLDRTRDGIMDQLKMMHDDYQTNRQDYYKHADKISSEQTAQHKELAGKIAELEKLKYKATIVVMVVLAFLAGAGILGHTTLASIIKFIGL